MVTGKITGSKTMRLGPLVKLSSHIIRSNLHELRLPYRLTYAVTNRCQARCAMCNIWQKPVHDELSITEIDSLFSKANRFSWINLTGGELFQRPEISDILLTIIKHSRDLYLLNFPTNGFQTQEIVTAVKTILRLTSLPRLIVSVSLDGPPQLHDDIRGVAGCWDHAIDTFRQLRELHSRRFSVYFGHTVQAANQGKFDATLNACRASLSDINADNFHINLAHSSGHYYDNADTDALPDLENAVHEIERISTLRKQKLFDPVAFIERRYHQLVRHYVKNGRVPFTCQAAAASCFINPQGTVFPCSVFDAPLGSLREYDMDFYRLWRGRARHCTRESIRKNTCPGCWTPCEAYQTILATMLKRKGKR